MKLPYAEPDPAGSERARKAKSFRDLATEIARNRPQALTKANGEEADHGPTYPANFTKGLAHNEWGVVDEAEHYQRYVKAINAPERTRFEDEVVTAEDAGAAFECTVDGAPPDWRGWESPRAGHVYELQGPDAGAVGMAPAPRVGSSELAAEMAEVYALAILRDVPFSEIAAGGDQTLIATDPAPPPAQRDATAIVAALNDMPFFDGHDRVSSTPATARDGLNRFERNRRDARTLLDPADQLTTQNLFRGSTPGAQTGPYISQFMLIGVPPQGNEGGGASGFPGLAAAFDLQDGFVPYGSLIIDQRTRTHTNGLDYMTDWASWRDVQNGANVGGIATFEENRRFITTPRDLGTYVHYDALYEAYLNAALILLALEVPASKGFPERSPSGNRTPFATFGGPHVLSLVTEVATRCLKAVRRQKFNYHRRARPEALGGRLTVAKLGFASELQPVDDPVGSTAVNAFEALLAELPTDLQDAVIDHNVAQNHGPIAALRALDCSAGTLPTGVTDTDFDACNLLLPMAFPEGSPMHPAYGAGHATVAGGCVTILKAFFEMFDDHDSTSERILQRNGAPIAYEPNSTGSTLVGTGDTLTIQGELDKLAANISIGRNMAGVHYYSDYYDSARMGERIAVGILAEQAPTYGDEMEVTFTSFDGDLVTIYGEGGSCPSLSIIDRNGRPVDPDDWWLRHVPGREFSEDL